MNQLQAIAYGVHVQSRAHTYMHIKPHERTPHWLIAGAHVCVCVCARARVYARNNIATPAGGE